jgi:LmbE family N-acetylglucosaminyl deacetylase
MLEVALGGRSDAALRILCLGAHSDDIEIGCGGTLLRLLKERPGCVVDWVIFSATPEREREARASAAEFLADAERASVVVKGFRESYFPAEWPEVKGTVDELRALQPDVVFCHRKDDEHQDHRTLGELVWNSFRRHLIFEYEIPKYEGDLGHPNVFVPLSHEVAARKVELIVRHFASQAGRAWFRPATFHGLLAIRGVECNAAEGWAEGFTVRKLRL